MNKKTAIALLLAFALMLSACGTYSDNTNIKSSSTNSSTANSSSTASSKISVPTATPTPRDGLKSDGKLHVYLVGKGEKVSNFDSSFIDYITYYSSSKHLIICMNGKEYVFANVSSSLWSDFKSADSKGTFYNQNIRGNTSYHVNDYDGSNGNLIVMEFLD